MKDYLVSSIKRVYDDCHRALEDDKSQAVGGAIIDRYNELLDEIKSEYPDNERIQNLNPVERTGAGIVTGASNRPRSNDLQEVKFGTAAIADALELDIVEFKRVQNTDTIPIIQINQNQTQQQSQQQTITIESIYQEVDGLMVSPEQKENIESQVREFEEELESENPDKDRMKAVIDFVRDTSKQLAVKLTMLALTHGIDLLASNN